MAWYRLYFFNAKDKISRALDMECESDEAAMSSLADHPHKHALELWQGARRVSRVEPGSQG